MFSLTKSRLSGKTLFLVFIFILCSTSILAQTTVPGGNISGTWTTANSPYLINGNITIHADSSLSIEQGVEVIFQGLYSLQVNGSLVAIGTEVDSISFCPSDTSVGWRGIRIDAGADSSRLSYATIDYGRNADGGGIYCRTPNATITHCSVTNNYASTNGGGIYVNTGAADPPVINNCII
ncbi:hypothetical protein K8R42_02680, partial [bacterium]|nr:hypothetical protein [bacterium]